MTHRSPYRTTDPDVRRNCYSVAEIASSYQASHVMIWNMPSDDELLHALKINGHNPIDLDSLKTAYRRLSRKLWTGE